MSYVLLRQDEFVDCHSLHVSAAVPLRPALRMDQVHAELLSWDIQKDVLAVGNNRYYNSAGTKPEKAISFPHGLQQYVDMFK